MHSVLNVLFLLKGSRKREDAEEVARKMSPAPFTCLSA